MASIRTLLSVEGVMARATTRQQFEQHMQHVGFHQNRLQRDHHDKQYLSSTVHNIWYGWCAAIAAQESENQ